MNSLERTWQDNTLARARIWADRVLGPVIPQKSHDLASERFGDAGKSEHHHRRLPEFRTLSSNSPYLFSPPIDFPVLEEVTDRYRFESLACQDEIFSEVLGYAMRYRRGDSLKRAYAHEVLLDDLVNKDLFSIEEELLNSRAIDLDILARPVLCLRLLPRRESLSLYKRISELPLTSGREASLMVYCRRALPSWFSRFRSGQSITAPALRDKLHDEREALMSLFNPLAEI